jgi:hypothetical protein
MIRAESCFHTPGISWSREILPVPNAATFMRLLGAFFPSTDAGIMVGKALTMSVLATAPLAVDRRKSRLLMALFLRCIGNNLIVIIS